MAARERSRILVRAALLLAGLHLAGALAAWVLLRFYADAWWPATLLLFGPRWVLALPLLVTIPAALLTDRRVFALVGGAVVALVAVMDFRVPIRAAISGGAGKDRLRVMTYNIGGGRFEPAELERLVTEIAPDIAGFQECGGLVDARRFRELGFHVHESRSQCLLSRHPIRTSEVRDPRDVWAMNGSGAIVRYEIDTPAGLVNFANLHLETVRDGLGAVMGRRLKGVPELEANIRQRAFESRIAREWVRRGSAPTIVVGDFNMPVESAIYAEYWSDYQNAFSVAGLGLGVSKATRWHGVRIDHVLAGPEWACKSAFVARHLGLDHRPVVAEFELRAPAR
jgi:vancomycin resistance protein VanJ